MNNIMKIISETS